ncbi:MBL fold metallo-hydrolase [Tahibacter caeni]|uniref:MBL fold metallo-hydrolase n=1 Tax=Tahibacter caeni TaxID=1453545 RepID=UPI00214940FD|nr:MBL fold metallo-hydrolase [Tahibacter caeni]
MIGAAPRIEVHLLQVGRCRHPEWITLRGGRWSAAEFPALSALLIHPTHGALLYDTGYAAHFDAATARFPECVYRWITPVQLAPAQTLQHQLAARGVALGDVRRVLISHLHADHVAGLRDLPNARFSALRGEIAGLAGLSRLRGLTRAILPALLPADFAARLDYADDAPGVALGPLWAPFDFGHDLLGDGSLLAVPLPGHSRAQMGLLLRDRDDRPLLLAADACWSARAWREQRMPSLLARPLMHDWQAYRATLAGLQAVARRQPELLIVPSHCAETLQAYAPATARAAA